MSCQPVSEAQGDRRAAPHRDRGRRVSDAGGLTMTAVTIIDETTSGGAEHTLTLEFLDERLTVRELIRSRVFQEVTEYNAGARGLFRGLVQPAGSQRTRGGFLVPGNRMLD